MATTGATFLNYIILTYLIGVGIYLFAEFVFWDSYLMPSKYTDKHQESVYVKSVEIPDCDIIDVLDKDCGIQVKRFKYHLFDRYRIGLFWKNGDSVVVTRPGLENYDWLFKWLCIDYDSPRAIKELIEKYIVSGLMLTDVQRDHNLEIPKFESLGELSMKLQLGNTTNEKLA